MAVFERAGYRVLEALDGVHALAAAIRYLPDLIVSDAMLPRLDTVQLVARLKSSVDTRDLGTIVVRERTCSFDAVEAGCPVVTTDEDLLRECSRIVAQRTNGSAHFLTLRRAIADVRASAARAALDAMEITERARQMASGADEAMISVLVADNDARYVAANDAACALSGYSHDELLAMSMWDLTARERLPLARRQWKRFLREGRYEGSYRLLRRSGEQVTIRYSSVANVSPGLHVATMAPPRLLQVIRA